MAIAWKELEYKLEIKDKIKDHLTIPKGKTRVAGINDQQNYIGKTTQDSG